MALQLETFGRLRAYQDGNELDWLQSQRLRAALVTYLAIERVVQRASLVAVFWPESDEESARHALRQNLYQLRQVLGDEWVETRGAELRVSDDVRTDAGAFEAALTRGEFAAAARLYAGPFLDGVHPIDLKPWESWVDARRAHLAREFRRACREWVESCRERGDTTGAIEAAQCWTQPDALDDEAQHKLIEVLAEAGRRTDALRQYATYVRLLEAEDLVPLDETKALVERVEAEGAVGPVSLALSSVGEDAHVAHAAAYAEVFGVGEGVEAGSSTGQRVNERRRGRRLRQTLTVVSVLAGAILLAGQLMGGPGPDASVYALDVALPEVPGGPALFERHFVDALRRIPGLRAADPARLVDAGLDTAVEPLAASLRRARRAGAGRLIRLRGMPTDDGFVITGDLYDVGSRVHRVAHRIEGDSREIADAAEVAATLAETLFDVPGGALARAGSDDEAAVRSFVAGVLAEQEWKLQDALLSYRDAVTRDPSFARAAYRLARVLDWTGRPTGDWVEHVRRALAHRPLLEMDEAVLANALLAMGERRFQDACRHYETVLEVEPFNFVAQFGLGWCQRADDAVIPDPESASGWSFRSSHNASVAAFEKAFKAQPGLVFTFGRTAAVRLLALLYARPTQARIGTGIDGDTARFGAKVELVGDSLEFTPYPVAELQMGRVAGARGTVDAVHEGRRKVLAIVEGLVDEYPTDPRAMIVRAEVLESVNLIEGNQPESVSALEWARLAVRASPTPEDKVYATFAEVRILLKLKRYAEARDRAAAVLRDHGTAASVHPDDIAALAALTGQSHELVIAMERGALDRAGEDRFEGVPINVLRLRQRLLGYAMLGANSDSIRALVKGLEQATLYLDPSIRENRRCVLVAEPYDFAYTTLHTKLLEERCWNRMPTRVGQAALAAQNPRQALAQMDSADALREGNPPDRLSLDAAYLEAWVINAAGDPRRAADRLDQTLNAISNFSPERLQRPTELASLVRAMALRADVAVELQESDDARLWGAAVAELWRDADSAALLETSRRMKALARGT